MARRILIIVGHSDKDSLCGGLADAYESGAKEAGAEVRRLNLWELEFDPVLWKGYNGDQPLEPDLVKAQESISWSEHLVVFYPVWWDNYPALLKGFLDRVFLPGFGYRFRRNSHRWDKLLSGRTARLFVTTGGPAWVYALFFGAAGDKSMKKGVLEFCGISPVRITRFGGVADSTPALRERWIAETRRRGRRLE